MAEKTEWEVVDAPAEASPETRPTLRQLMKKLLGPWWKVKLVSVASIASLVLVFFAALAGVLVLALSAGALIATGIGKFRQRLRRGHGSISL